MAESPVISELESVIALEPVDEVFMALPRDEYAPWSRRLCASARSRGSLFACKLSSSNSGSLDGKLMM